MDQLGELSQFFRVLGFLGLLAVFAYILTKFLNKREFARKSVSGTAGIVLCDTRSLGNKQFLVVAKYEEEKFLLGISSGNIELLAKLNVSPPSAITTSEKPVV